jgi:hypothetical protein
MRKELKSYVREDEGTVVQDNEKDLRQEMLQKTRDIAISHSFQWQDKSMQKKSHVVAAQRVAGLRVVCVHVMT